MNIVSSAENLSGETLPRLLTMVVVDDHPEFLSLVSEIAELEHHIEVVCSGANGTEALHAVAECRPDVALIDIEMPVMNGLVAAQLLSKFFPRTKVILMSAEDIPEYRDGAKKNGAIAFIHKAHFIEEFASAISQLEFALQH